MKPEHVPHLSLPPLITKHPHSPIVAIPSSPLVSLTSYSHSVSHTPSLLALDGTHWVLDWQIMLAVCHLRRNGVAHRRLCAPNVLCDPSRGRVSVTGFTGAITIGTLCVSPVSCVCGLCVVCGGA